MKIDQNMLFYEPEDLPELGEALARNLKTAGTLRARGISKRVLRDLNGLLEACKCNSLDSEADREWLRDNLYLLQRDGKRCAAAFRSAGKLRRSEDDRALLLILTDVLIDSGCGQLTKERLQAFLEGFQRVSALTEAELALLPEALCASLIGRLERTRTDAASVVTSLRYLENTQLSGLLEAESALHRLLLRDPAGIYGKMDEVSRRDYRRQAALLGRRNGVTETEAAEAALRLAKEECCHVGEFLFRRPLGKKRKRGPVLPYLLLHLLLPAAAALYLCFLLGSVLPLLTFLPLREGVKTLFDSVYTRLTRPKRLPRLDYAGGIPAESRTLSVSAVLLTRPEDAEKAVEKLERFRLANRDAGRNLCFGLLLDYGESDRASEPADGRIREAAEAEISRLNGVYGGGFCLFTRQRSYSAPDRVWRGRERKRGAVMELTGLLRGEKGTVSVSGDAECVRDIRYLIVLDGDTRLNMGAAAELASVLAHPLQRPATDPETGAVKRGCAILQPKMSVSLADASRSDFARIFAGQGGLDPYGGLNSDVYQDLFGEGSYSGKGILDVDAFRSCLDGAFPPETLLSHDLIEGAYAGCAYVSDVELTDGFPAGLLSYYERQHRWIRGDWQTVRWLGRRVRNEAGKRVRNPIGSLSRWKILDNLCRSLGPVNTFLCILIYGAFPGRTTLLCAGVSLTAAAVRVILNAASGIRRGKRYRSRVLPAAKNDFLQLLWVILLLPYAAYVHGSATLTALYRTFISHRRMLLWVTAAEGDRRDSGSADAYCRRMWFSFAAGVMALCCVPVIVKALGVLWVLAPVAGWLISQERRGAHGITDAQRTEYTRCAADMWRYFRDTMTAERHFLPPDNVQKTPQTIVAERTSPTNIGLALLSIVTAMDLGLCEAEEGWERIRNTVGTVERLPKCRGHLYNWYDTRTAEPLEPLFLSTVDSGNLLACLYTLKAAAEEAGEHELAERVRRLCEAMKLDFLYDPEKRLLRIGWDPAEDGPAGGWYDLLESEARITSYLALARGEAPKKHWQRLGRVPVCGDGMSGLASWTGTMFEYFMPLLFMPAPEGSLLGESAEFCLRVQKRSGLNGVWGRSESAFAATDAAGSYAYKAHGAQKLALKRGMDRDAVFAPYAAFLAAEEAPNAVLRVLQKYRRRGMEGSYGFFEALDLTPGRSESGTPVRCFMSHHLGMSMVSLNNLLSGGIMRERFLREPAFAACTELLEEKTPVGQRIRTDISYEADARPSRSTVPGFVLRSEAPDFPRPMTGLLSNGRYQLLVNELGYHRSRWGSIALTAAEPSAYDATPGLCFFADTDGSVFPLQPLPFDAPGIRHSAAYDGVSFTQFTRCGGMEFSMKTQVSERSDAELDTVTLVNTGKEPRRVTLALYLEPMLCREESYRSHPAFHRLCLESGMTSGCLTVSRRPGGREAPAALAIACPEGFEAETDKAGVFGRGGVRNMPEAILRRGSDVRAASEPCVFLRVRMTLRPKERKALRFALGAGETAARAAAEADAALRGKTEGARFRFACQRYTEGQENAALRLLTQLVSETPEKATLREQYRRWDAGMDGLWRCGISGDLPVAACEGSDGELLLRCRGFLRALGYSFDLAIRTSDGGVYGSPEQTALRRFAAKLGLGEQEGVRGGWHLFSGSESEWFSLLAKADSYGIPAEAAPSDTANFLPGMTPKGVDTKAVRRVTFAEAGVTAVTDSGVGRRAWSGVLTNGRLGWVAADDGSGYLWLDNAREQRLTRWQNDPLAALGTEELTLIRDGRPLSLFAAADAWPTETTFGLGHIRWKRRFDRTETEVMGFIPPGRNERILLVRLNEAREGDRIGWQVRTDLEHEMRLRSGEEPLEYGALPGETHGFRAEYPAARELVLSLGTETDGTTDPAAAEKLLRETEAYWREITGRIRLHSPSPALDRYVNGWCLYQTLACRVLGRASLYQSGGAFGFRDQLQDVCALIDPLPQLSRGHILLAAAHQYEEGDVMHWWHPGKAGDRGVRTRCADDLLWLPYAAMTYVEKTGDRSILDEPVPWLRSALLREEEADRYETPEVCGADTLIKHLRRACERVLERGTGGHGLLLIGAGDWNDGFDRVGGESVWLTWFASMVFRRFGMLTGEARWTEEAETLSAAADACFRDGQYLRAFFADGTPLGAAGDAACELDSIAQSFSVFCGTADPEKSRAAVRKAADVLLDRKNRLVKLFTPPFDGETDPGYIRSYLPGVRENGGQYTHAAVWLAGACLRCGEIERGWELLETLLPGGRDENVYQAEPFVLAADVYANPDMTGRGGWSWYTGAAGWFLRVTVEELLGVRVQSGAVTVQPRLPEAWGGYTLEYTSGGERYRIEARREAGTLRSEVKKL